MLALLTDLSIIFRQIPVDSDICDWFFVRAGRKLLSTAGLAIHTLYLTISLDNFFYIVELVYRLYP